MNISNVFLESSPLVFGLTENGILEGLERVFDILLNYTPDVKMILPNLEEMYVNAIEEYDIKNLFLSYCLYEIQDTNPTQEEFIEHLKTKKKYYAEEVLQTIPLEDDYGYDVWISYYENLTLNDLMNEIKKLFRDPNPEKNITTLLFLASIKLFKTKRSKATGQII